MKIVLVAYYFAPIENVAAQRWNRYARFLALQGHEVEVWTNDWGKLESNALLNASGNLKRVIVYDPLSQEKAFYTSNKTSVVQDAGLKAQIKKWVPVWLLIDGKWLWSLKVLWKLLSRDWDASTKIIVTGNPWSAVTAVAIAAKILRRPYLVDFRDQWSKEPFAKFKSPLARAYFTGLERRVVSGARAFITVTDPIEKQLSAWKASAIADASLVLPNGFEGSVGTSAQAFNALEGKTKHILYGGTVSVYHGVGDFIRALEGARPPLAFVGSDATGLVSEHGFEHIPPVSEKNALELFAKAGVLLLILDREATGYISGKLMSYLKAGRPILYFGPAQSPAAHIIESSSLGWVVDVNEPGKLKTALDEIRAHFESGKPFAFEPRFAELEQYSVDKLGPKLAAFLAEVS
jgi:glycosyltransferase involved in cell wall biosynthesis